MLAKIIDITKKSQFISNLGLIKIIPIIAIGKLNGIKKKDEYGKKSMSIKINTNIKFNISSIFINLVLFKLFIIYLIQVKLFKK